LERTPEGERLPMAEGLGMGVLPWGPLRGGQLSGNHSRNVHSFTLYGLPAPSASSYAIGTLEIVGALALISGIALLPLAVALAGDMVGAIVVSGIALGALVSLTLAPATLAAMLVLIARELRGSRGGRGATGSSRLRDRSKSAACARARRH
jgi:hypothetical protein